VPVVAFIRLAMAAQLFGARASIRGRDLADSAVKILIQRNEDEPHWAKGVVDAADLTPDNLAKLENLGFTMGVRWLVQEELARIVGGRSLGRLSPLHSIELLDPGRLQLLMRDRHVVTAHDDAVIWHRDVPSHWIGERPATESEPQPVRTNAQQEGR